MRAVSTKLMQLLGLVVLLAVCGCGGSADETSTTSNPRPAVESDLPTFQGATEEGVASDVGTAAVAELDPEPAEVKVPDPKDVYPDPIASLTATEFFGEFVENIEAWQEKYHYKVVEVQGKVVSYYSSNHAFKLELETESRILPVVVSEEAAWVKYPPNTIVTVRGEAVLPGYPELERAVVVDSKPGDPLTEHSAQEAAESIEKDGFEPEWILVKGTVTRRLQDEELKRPLICIGESDKNLVAALGNDNYDSLHCRDLKAGDEVVFLAKGNDVMVGDDLPLLYPSFLVSPVRKLPAQPKAESRVDLDGNPAPHLIFTAELLGEWQVNSRALKRVVEQHSGFGEAEITGEVLETKPSDDDDDEVFVELKNAAQTNVRAVVDKDDDILGKIHPGTTISVVGRLKTDPRNAYIRDGRITIK